MLKRDLIGTKPRNIIVEKMTLQPGGNRVIFKANLGTDRADSKIHNGDKRKLSICFGKLVVKEISR